ncbi:MAG: hypothetical protein P8Q97_18315 [Myxococcota bacterium]|jgi:maleate isomerase|nr:hypothetical protein [Myxococcota bacterium]
MTVKNRIGCRHIFGVLVPDFNSVVEPELADMRIAGVSNQTTRFPLDAAVLEHLASAAERLRPSGIQSWIIGLATDSFANGLELMNQGIEILRERTGLPVHTASYAVHDALAHLSAHAIGIVTPFDHAGNDLVRATYEERGFEVKAIAGLARPSFDQIANTTDEETGAAFGEIAESGADVLVQVGTGLPTLHLIEELEKRHNRPVVTSNQASYWQGLRSAGIADSVPGAGRLLR